METGRRPELRRRLTLEEQQAQAAARPQEPQQPARAPRPAAPEQDPRQGTPRPRPAGTAATGQFPVARTRATSAGPTGTARIPVVRQNPSGPAAARPGVRPPEPNAPRELRSRLRTPPPAPPRIPGAFESLRPASRPTPVQPIPTQAAPIHPAAPVAQPAPVVQPRTAPVRAVTVAEPEAREARPRRHRARGVMAALFVVGLCVLYGLPAFAAEALAAPPVEGVAAPDDVQRFQVGTDVDAGSVSADGASGSMPVIAAPSWIDPVAGRLGDPYGPRPEQPVPGVSLYHRGQDIVAPCGRQIRAAHSGTVTAATYWGTYGNWILIDGGDGVAVGYAHESQILVSVGQKVKVGQVIGLVGETGAATGCHLHLEVHLNGVAVNPVPFFASKKISLG